MINEKYKDPIPPAVFSNPKLKEYYCPHCHQMIMKGNVKRLRMACPHCTLFINMDEKQLLLNEIEEYN